MIQEALEHMVDRPCFIARSISDLLWNEVKLLSRMISASARFFFDLRERARELVRIGGRKGLHLNL